MEFIVAGGNKHQRSIIESVAEFMKSKYLAKYRSVFVEFNIDRRLAENHGADGACYANSSYRPRVFDIDLNGKMDDENLIKTTIHELVHVKQYVKGELVDRGRGKYKTLWNGKDHTKTSYSRQPWEREAYRLQESLYIEYINNR